MALNSYTFRTTLDDPYLDRVMAEAEPTTNFLLVKDENKQTGAETLFILVRKAVTALSLIDPNLKISGVPLTEWFHRALDKSSDEPFVVQGVQFEGDDSKLAEALAKETRIIEQDIRHINNVLNGRMAQITVTAL